MAGEEKKKSRLTRQQKVLIAIVVVLAAAVAVVAACKSLFVRPTLPGEKGETGSGVQKETIDYGEGARPRADGERKSEDYYTILVLGRDTGGAVGNERTEKTGRGAGQSNRCHVRFSDTQHLLPAADTGQYHRLPQPVRLGESGGHRRASHHRNRHIHRGGSSVHQAAAAVF